MNRIISLLFIVILTFKLNAIAGGECYNTYLTEHVHSIISKNVQANYTVLVNDNASFVSGELFKTNYVFDKNKKYKICLVSEQIVDITTISILDQDKNILASLSNQTGDERNIIELNFTPPTSGKFSIYFKVINYAGQNTCGNYLIFYQ